MCQFPPGLLQHHMSIEGRLEMGNCRVQVMPRGLMVSQDSSAIGQEQVPGPGAW